MHCHICHEDKASCLECSLLMNFSNEEPRDQPNYQNVLKKHAEIIEKIMAQKTEIADLEKTLKEDEIKVQLKNEKYLEVQEEIEKIKKTQKILEERKRELQSKSINLRSYLEWNDSLRKETNFGLNRVFYKLEVDSELQFQLVSENKIALQSLILALGTKRLNNVTKDAHYFIVLDSHIEKIEEGKWKCKVPNPLNLEGEYFFFLGNFHRPNPDKIKLVMEPKNPYTKIKF